MSKTLECPSIEGKTPIQNIRRFGSADSVILCTLMSFSVRLCHFLYADDLKIFTCCESQFIQQDLNALLQWSVLNWLSFHPSKYKILPFNFDCSQVLKLGETALDYTDYVEKLLSIKTQIE